MRIITVLPLKKGVRKGSLTYFTNLDIPPLHIVSIPMRNKRLLGLVLASEELRDAKGSVKGMDFNLRKVTEDKGGSVFTPEFIEAVFDSSKYFAQNPARAIASLIPNIFLEEYDKLSKISAQSGTASPVKNQSKEKNLRAEKSLLQSPLPDRISIYKTMVRESFSKGKSVFIVLPTELEIESFSKALSKGIERFTYKVHSGQSPKKNLSACEKIMGSTHPVLIIGTTQYLSIPRHDIGTIILEHESGSSYRSIALPYFDLRTFTETFAFKLGAKFIMADGLLRFETLERKDKDSVSALHPPSYRIEFDGIVEVLGKNANKEKREKFQVLKKESLEEIKATLQNKKNVFIFSLRKGLATITVCRDCGNQIACDKCGSVLVLYMSKSGKRMFVCNKCGREKDPDTTCELCGSWNLLPLGIGTDTVHEYLKETIPKAKIFKLDKESAKNKKGAEKIVAEFESSSGAILVGTEMALFYLKTKVHLSVIASFDSLWSIPSFRMGEKIIRLMLSILEQTEKKLIIQVRNERDNAILAVVRENLMPYVRQELEDRKSLGYPPFKRFIKITFMGDKMETTKAREALKEVFKDYGGEVFSGFIPGGKDRYTTNMLIKMEPKMWSLPALTLGGSIDEALLAKLSSLPPSFQVSVDPEDLL